MLYLYFLLSLVQGNAHVSVSLIVDDILYLIAHRVVHLVAEHMVDLVAEHAM